MLTTTTALALIFSSPPTAPPDRFDAQLDHVDVTVSDGDALIVALDSNGETIGSLALWVDDAGITWIAVDYTDGYAVLRIDPFTETVTHEGELPAAVLADRADAVLAALADPAQPAAETQLDRVRRQDCIGRNCLLDRGPDRVCVRGHQGQLRVRPEAHQRV